MRSSTVKLSKPDRLNIKKKLMILMNVPFHLTQHSSPSRRQFDRCQIRNRDNLIPYPYWLSFNNDCEDHGPFFGIHRNEVSRSYTMSDNYSRMYRDSSLIPISIKKFELSDDVLDHWYIGETEFDKRNEIIIVKIELIRSRGVDSWINNYRTIKLRYGIETKRLNISSNLSEPYDKDKILDIINTTLFSMFIY